MHLGRDHRGRRIRAHAAGIRAGVAIADALVVLRRRHRQRGHAIHHRDETGFLAVQEFLDDDARAGIAERVAVEHVAHCGFGFVQGHRHDHALAGGQAIGLHDDGRAFLPDVSERGIDLGVHGIERGGDAVAFEELLGVGLAAFQLRGRGGRAEDAMSGGAEAVDHARHQRHFRADHGQRDAFAFDQREQAVDVGGFDCGIATAGFGRGAGIARRDNHFRHARRLRKLPRQRVFAAAGTDDEEFHGEPSGVLVGGAARERRWRQVTTDRVTTVSGMTTHSMASRKSGSASWPAASRSR